MRALSATAATIFLDLVEWGVTNVPGAVGRALRYQYYKRRLKSIGKGVKIDVGVRILNPAYVSIGDNTWIDNYVVILAGPPMLGDGPMAFKDNPDFDLPQGEVHIGNNVHVANFVVIQGHGGVKIGDDCGVASASLIYSMSHHHSNLADRSETKKYKFTPMVARREQSLVISPVVMGEQSALGLNSVLLPGATVGAGTWVGCSSVVTQRLPENALAAGNPAQVVKSELHPGWRAKVLPSG